MIRPKKRGGLGGERDRWMGVFEKEIKTKRVREGGSFFVQYFLAVAL